MNKNTLGFLGSLLLLLLTLINPAAARPTFLPDSLVEWQDWVLHEYPEMRCPFFHNSGEYHCRWPSTLDLQVNDSGATFDMRLQLYSDSEFALPGEHEHWPQQVMVEGRRLAVTDVEGTPVAKLPAGSYTLSGRFEWSAIPRTLRLPDDAGVVTLTLRGESIIPVRLEQGHQLVLGQAQAQTEATPEDSLSVRVYRHLSDTIPLQLTTQVQVDVSGRERELVLGQILPAGFTPRQFESPLPARIESDGQLRAQLKPGRWQFTLHSYSLAPPAQLGFAKTTEHWPEEEIWVFDADNQHRSVKVTGAPAIDPAQTSLPDAWRHLPAYLLTPDTQLVLEEQHRAPNHYGDHQLQLDKTLWLDFAGDGFTVRDRISGTLSGDARLEVTDPYELGSASLNGDPLLVTRLAPDQPAGIELRDHLANIHALGRLPRQLSLPVSGWQSEFSGVDTTLHLPPGWSLLTASGADRVSGAWLQGWNLWNIFLVLIISVAVARAGNWPLGLLTLVTLVLIYQRQGAPLLMWLNLAACLALVRLVSERWQKHLRLYTLASFVLLALVFLHYAAREARLGIYPQLEHPQSQTRGGESDTKENNYISDIAMPLEREAGEAGIEEVLVSGMRHSRRIADDSLGGEPQASRSPAPPAKTQYMQKLYAPNQQIQAGPAEQNWQWNRAHLGWSGPVTAEQTTRLILLPPLLDRIGHALAVFLPLLLAVLLWRQLQLPSPRLPRGTTAAPAVAALLLAVALLPSEPVNAEVLVDSELLEELQERLTRDPDCLPHCAAIESVTLNAEDDRLQLEMRVHAREPLALPLPVERGSWQPQAVTVNGQVATLKRDSQGWLTVSLPAGSHRVQLSGSLADLQQLNLPFGLPIHNLSSQTRQWQLNGAPRSGYVSRDLQLERLASDTEAGSAGETSLQPTEMPPFVYVRRRLTLGLEWTVETVVQRRAPARGAINLSVPLLPGEAPLSGKVDNGRMTVSLAPEQSAFSWQSVLPISEQLTLEAAGPDSPWVEQWRINVAPVWHVDTSGTATLAGSPDNRFWQPRPGDSLTLAISRPEAVPGEDLTITHAQLTQHQGERGQTVDLVFTIKTFQGGHYRFTLPESAELTALSVAGQNQPLIKTTGEISIPVNPGEQEVSLSWRNSEGISALLQTPALGMGHPVGNIHLQQSLPRDRWTLMTGGPTLGPAVLVWSILAIVLLVAIGLGRSRLTPLKTWEWVLLGLGIVTVSGLILGLVALCFIALSQRGQTQPLRLAQYFNPVQILLILLSLLTLAVLVSAIPYGLLAEPAMMVRGNGSSAHWLQWYTDRSEGALPQAWVISLPLWAYRLAMLCWSLWLALALTRWLPWAWRQLGSHGWWLSATQAKAQQQQDKLDLDLPEEK